MKELSLILVFSILLVSSPMSAQTAVQATVPGVEKPLAFGLPDGTPLKLRLNRTMSSADAKTGETVDFEVLEAVKIGDTTIIPRGGIATGTVTAGKPKGRVGKGGKLDINIDSVRTVLGEKIALRAVKETKGGNSTGAMTGAIVASSILFFPAAPFFLLLKGKDITIPQGTEITAYVSGNTELTDPNRYFAYQTLLGGKSPSGFVGLANLAIKSEPDGAEIMVDGKFVGNTPSSMYLKSGEHTIAIKKTGFRTWEQFIRLEVGSNITLHASLEFR